MRLHVFNRHGSFSMVQGLIQWKDNRVTVPESMAFERRKSNYGYGWFNEKKHGRKCISHAGGVPGFLANLQFYPADDLCIILLSNSVERDIFTDSDKLAAMVFKETITNYILPTLFLFGMSSGETQE